MQAIILAAGMGKRLKALTRDNTKCMVKVNGVTLIERLLHQLEKYRLTRIVIVVGYLGQKLVDYVKTLDVSTEIVFVENPVYDTTNNIHSLYLAKDYLCAEDTLLFESDLIFDDGVIDLLVDDPWKNLVLVDKYENWMDGTCTILNDDGTIREFVNRASFDFREIDSYYKTVNVYKFSREFSKDTYVPFLEAYTKVLGNNEYYEQVLRVIALLESKSLKAKKLTGQKWYEIDDVQDLDIASSIFARSDEERVELMNRRYGGFWRYPNLKDFCYLVNPYFPPKRMVDEMKNSFEKLLTQYPSGMEVNTLLASKMFGIDTKNIIIGNGAAELIKVLIEGTDGDIGFIRPTFEEYPNRADGAHSVSFRPSNPDFSYGVDDIIGFFSENRVDTLILVNPDNPTGNYIPKDEVLRLVRWCGEKSMRIVVDESFVDFADETDATLLDQGIIDSNPHMYVIKSISKSYGVPGIRLGVLASADTGTVASMKKALSIWNINSFGEYFMQIEEKYKTDYAEALVRIRTERARYASELSRIPHIRVIPSQANYIMAELDETISSSELTMRLLAKYELLIKDLSKKTGGNYVRLAVRDTKDNDLLLAALRKELS